MAGGRPADLYAQPAIQVRFPDGTARGCGGHGRNNRVRVKTHNNVHVFVSGVQEHFIDATTL